MKKVPNLSDLRLSAHGSNAPDGVTELSLQIIIDGGRVGFKSTCM
jgi:hypothetical protein